MRVICALTWVRLAFKSFISTIFLGKEINYAGKESAYMRLTNLLRTAVASRCVMLLYYRAAAKVMSSSGDATSLFVCGLCSLPVLFLCLARCVYASYTKTRSVTCNRLSAMLLVLCFVIYFNHETFLPFWWCVFRRRVFHAQYLTTFFAHHRFFDYFPCNSVIFNSRSLRLLGANLWINIFSCYNIFIAYKTCVVETLLYIFSSSYMLVRHLLVSLSLCRHVLLIRASISRTPLSRYRDRAL